MDDISRTTKCNCEPGDPTNDARVKLHHPTKRGYIFAGVDPCIAPLVQTLNDAGLQTIASCCGHGHQPVWIALEDGREIFIVNHAQAQTIGRMFLDIHGNVIEEG